MLKVTTFLTNSEYTRKALPSKLAHTNSVHNVSLGNACQIVQTTKIETYFMIVDSGV